MTRSESGKLGALKSKITNLLNKQKRVEAYNTDPRICKTCEKPLPYEKRKNTYCNQSCAARTNVPIGRRTVRYKGPRLCVICRKERNTGRKYCVDCYKDVQKSRLGTWETVKTNHVARRLLLEEFGHRCFGCGLEKWLDVLLPLEVHHEDGDAENYQKENVKLLCPNCHALTPTFRNRNPQASEKRRRRRKTKDFAP